MMDMVLYVMGILKEWSDLLLIAVGLSAFGVYYWQKRDEKRSAATLIKGQIDLIEERIYALKSDHQLGNISIYHSKAILQENLWEKYKHLFIKRLQKSDAELIQKFYDSAEQIESMQEVIFQSYWNLLESKKR